MNNHAYDLRNNTAHQPERAPQKNSRPDLQVRVNSEAYEKEKFWGYAKFVFCAFAVTAAFIMIMSGVAKCNELDISIGQKTKQLEELKSNHVRLMAEVEKKQSREIIEDYAVSVLGMQPVQDYQKHTIHIEHKDSLISLESEDKGNGLKDFISGLFS